ncbi:MAG: hypothetical protein ACSHXI_11870 [Hoeflea sp.]|uniref:hypothetical protein n=1 Tax=Hoeflea sp. TaxID=1940281 RepID=UPI003EF4F775
MFKSYRFTAIAFGLICFSISGQAQEGANPEQGQGSDQEQPAQSYPLPFPIEIIEGQAAADTRERLESEARQREIDDLAAQQGMNAATQSMNDATQRMTNYAELQTWLVALGTAVLFATLWFAWNGNKAAFAAVKLARANSETELRAWVGYEGWKMSGIGEPGNIDAYLFILKWKNFGSTPAKNSVLVTGRADDREKFGIDGPIFPDNDGGAINPPGVIFQSEPLILSPEEILATRENPIFLRSVARYNCAFKGMEDRISDVVLAIHYIGAAGIDAIKAGEIAEANFAIWPTGRSEMN